MCQLCSDVHIFVFIFADLYWFVLILHEAFVPDCASMNLYIFMSYVRWVELCALQWLSSSIGSLAWLCFDIYIS